MKLALAHTLMLIGALTPLAQARIRAVLFCEHSSTIQYYNMKGTHADYSDVRPCYGNHPTSSTGCTSVQTDIMYSVGGDGYDTFQWAYTMQLQCDSPERAGICRRYGSTWYRVRQCSVAGHEAVVTLVHDHDPNRRLGGKDQEDEEDFQVDVGPTEVVDIDGESWTIIGIDDEDEEEEDDEEP